MANFMPRDPQRAQELSERLSRTIFRSPEDFVKFYNDGLINRRHEDVQKLAKEITSLYRDVQERGNNLVVLSQEEVLLDELSRSFDNWKIIVKAKRALRELLESETLSNDDTVYFTSESTGYILALDEEGERIRVGNEKLFSKLNEISEIWEKYSTAQSDEEGVYAFKVSDLYHLDDSFVVKVAEIFPN